MDLMDYKRQLEQLIRWGSHITQKQLLDYLELEQLTFLEKENRYYLVKGGDFFIQEIVITLDDPKTKAESIVLSSDYLDDIQSFSESNGVARAKREGNIHTVISLQFFIDKNETNMKHSVYYLLKKYLEQYKKIEYDNDLNVLDKQFNDAIHSLVKGQLITEMF